VEDVLDALALPTPTRRALEFHWAGKAVPVNRVSFRELMNLVVAPSSEGLDYLVIPALEVRGVGGVGFRASLNGIQRLNLDGVCREESTNSSSADERRKTIASNQKTHQTPLSTNTMNAHILQESASRSIGLLSRRRLLRRVLCSAAGLPLLGASAFLPSQLLAATEESPETENNWEGPFYKPGAPVRSVFLEKGMAGTPLTLTGCVLDTHGRPLKGALLDLWHADRTGTYDNRGFTLRGKLYTDDEGRYTLRTIKPLYYGAPGDMRPSHIHVKASFQKSPILTTQLYFKGDPWNATDAGVRPSLILSPRKESDGLIAKFDFVIMAELREVS